MLQAAFRLSFVKPIFICIIYFIELKSHRLSTIITKLLDDLSVMMHIVDNLYDC